VFFVAVRGSLGGIAVDAGLLADVTRGLLEEWR
jgi:hypothetical protein